MNANGNTRTPTATPNGNQGGARALAGCVKIVTELNVALCALEHVLAALADWANDCPNFAVEAAEKAGAI